MLNEDYYRFAKQCGASDIVAHLCDYGVKGGESQKNSNQPVGGKDGWGIADHAGLWPLEELLSIRDQLAAHGLRFYAVENFDPAQWHDILLDGPKRSQQLEQAKEQLRIFAKAGIEVFGYNFSLTGVTGRVYLKTRGEADVVGLDGSNQDIETPLENGMVWNMRYDESAESGVLPPIREEELWRRLSLFLGELVPVAEECGIKLAAHPDDPPLPLVKGQPKLVHRHAHYQRLLDTFPSESNQLEFCVGTLAEMEDEDLYACVERYSAQKKIAYVHLRNVKGRVPSYKETFIDEGDVDIGRVLRVLAENGFDGVIIPDHAPQMTCDAPWHAGMAFAMGYLKAKMDEANKVCG